MDSAVVLWIVVGTALAFDFTNGFHDTANSVATSISTRALSPRLAVTLAAILNFVGAFISLAVAATIAKGIVNADLVTPAIVFAGLVGRDRLEPRHLVLRAALVVLARADRRRGRRDVRGRGRVGRLRLRAARQGHRAGARRAGARLHRRRPRDPDRLPDRRAPAARAGHARIPARPAHLREPARALARDERRAEDDGDHLPRAGRERQRCRRTPTSRPGSSSPRRPRSRSAPTSAAGGSSARWAAGSSRWTRRRASRPRVSAPR